MNTETRQNGTEGIGAASELSAGLGMRRLLGDFCRCTGKDCERRETCLRFIAWRDKDGPRFISVSEKLCQWDGPRCFQDSYIPNV